nr:hypothetical protein [Tanacetum cinerariifolium]
MTVAVVDVMMTGGVDVGGSVWSGTRWRWRRGGGYSGGSVTSGGGGGVGDVRVFGWSWGAGMGWSGLWPVVAENSPKKMTAPKLKSSLSRLRPDSITKSLTPSLDGSQRRRFMPVTPS